MRLPKYFVHRALQSSVGGCSLYSDYLYVWATSSQRPAINAEIPTNASSDMILICLRVRKPGECPTLL